MLWQLGCTGLCLLLCIPIVRGLFAVHSLEQRACLELRSFVLARAFHRPLYTTCLLLVALRVAFFSLTAMNKLETMDVSLKVAAFWLLDMPTVAMTALHGYTLLFAVRLVFGRRWPDATTYAPNTVLNAIFVAFYMSLVALATLVAVCQAGDKSILVVPRRMTLGYSALIWTTLGLLMVKYEGLAVQILWKYRRRNQWSVTDGEKRSRQRLPVLSISCLKNLTLCSTLLAELSVIRGVLCAVAACHTTGSDLDAVDVDSWQSMVLHYFGWEVASVAIVLRMLHQTPIAVHCFSTGKTQQRSSNTPSAPAIDDCEIQVQFQVPSVRELVAGYVVPSNTSLLSAQRRGMENAIEHRYCRMHHSGASSGIEYVNCRCCREGDDQFLSHANVPLLTEEYEPLTDGSLAFESAMSISTNDNRSTGS